MIGALVAIFVLAGVIWVASRSDAPRSGTTSCATTSTQCEIGDIGPGGGKVFSLGTATAPADCTTVEVVCLEVAPLAWQNSPSTPTTTDEGFDLATATTAVARYSTTTTEAGTWRLPTQNELNILANLSTADQEKVKGFRDAFARYWSSTTGQRFNNLTGTYDQTNFIRGIQDTGGFTVRLRDPNCSLPIHPF
jgi:hypothetical protein